MNLWWRRLRVCCSRPRVRVGVGSQVRVRVGVRVCSRVRLRVFFRVRVRVCSQVKVIVMRCKLKFVIFYFLKTIYYLFTIIFRLHI